MIYSISITGELGSGKSTVSKKLAAELDAKRVSTGDIFREKAASLGVSIEELSKRCESDPRLDSEIDESSAAIPLGRKSVIIDSRMAWHFAKNNGGTFKVYLTCDTAEGARRIYEQKRPEERTESIAEMLEKNHARRQSERARYLKYYGVDCLDLARFDCVVDTTVVNADEVARIVCEACEAYYSGLPYERYLIAPCNISLDGAAEDGLLELIRDDGGEFTAVSGAAAVRAALEGGMALVAADKITLKEKQASGK